MGPNPLLPSDLARFAEEILTKNFIVSAVLVQNMLQKSSIETRF